MKNLENHLRPNIIQIVKHCINTLITIFYKSKVLEVLLLIDLSSSYKS